MEQFTIKYDGIEYQSGCRHPECDGLCECRGKPMQGYEAEHRLHMKKWGIPIVKAKNIVENK